MSLRRDRCHQFRECLSCREQYLRSAKLDLVSAAEKLGNVWATPEPISESEWRKVRYAIESSPNTRLTSLKINERSNAQKRTYDLFYLKVPTSNDMFFLAIGCKDRPDMSYEIDWKKMDIHSETKEWSELFYTDYGRKSGKLNNFCKYFDELQPSVVFEEVHIEASKDITEEVLERTFEIAKKKTADLRFKMEIAPDLETDIYYRQQLILQLGMEWAWQLNNLGLLVSRHIRKRTVEIANFYQLE